MNRVLLTGRLTRDPEMRSLANSKTVTTFSVATHDYRGGHVRTIVQGVTRVSCKTPGLDDERLLIGTTGSARQAQRRVINT